MSAQTPQGGGDGSRAARRRRARQDLKDWQRGQRVQAAWAGLQHASLATHAKVEYLPVMGPQTTAGATSRC